MESCGSSILASVSPTTHKADIIIGTARLAFGAEFVLFFFLLLGFPFFFSFPLLGYHCTVKLASFDFFFLSLAHHSSVLDLSLFSLAFILDRDDDYIPCGCFFFFGDFILYTLVALDSLTLSQQNE